MYIEDLIAINKMIFVTSISTPHTNPYLYSSTFLFPVHIMLKLKLVVASSVTWSIG